MTLRGVNFLWRLLIRLSHKSATRTPMEILMFLDEISIFPWFSYGAPPCRIDIMGIYAEKQIYLYKDTKNVIT